MSSSPSGYIGTPEPRRTPGILCSPFTCFMNILLGPRVPNSNIRLTSAITKTKLRISEQYPIRLFATRRAYASYSRTKVRSGQEGV